MTKLTPTDESTMGTVTAEVEPEGWQLVGDDTPSCGINDQPIELLVYHPDYGRIVAFLVNRDQEGGSWTWHDTDGHIFEKAPTHWHQKPLPAPPKDEPR